MRAFSRVHSIASLTLIHHPHTARCVRSLHVTLLALYTRTFANRNHIVQIPGPYTCSVLSLLFELFKPPVFFAWLVLGHPHCFPVL